MNLKRFFDELKRRNVYRVAVAYAVVAWLLIQLASILFPTFDAPGWVMKVFVAMVALGFPLALVFAWAFELTPEGIKRTDDVAPNESISPRSGRKLAAGIAVLAVLAAGLLAYQLFRPGSSTIVQATISDKSIAVLPFENLSDEKANAYFASGIQDEILTRLSKIGALKVISRSSTKQYESKPGNLREVGQQLGAANILEGSVQKAGDVVHINVQLIRAASDEHLWAESYNRKLNDIFAVQGEVAGAIAEALNAKLSGAEQQAITARPTENPAAYDAYLRGLDAENQPFGPEQLMAASRAFAEAVKLDPNFALAWAHGSTTDGLLYAQAFDRSAERLAAARRGAEMAMRLAAESAEAWLAKGYLLYHTQDYAGALTALQEAGRRSPNNAEVLSARAFVERRRGNYEKGRELLAASLDRNPRDVRLLTELADTLIQMRRPAEARQWLDRVLSIRPAEAGAHGMKALSYLAEGDAEKAGQLLDALPPQLNDVSAFGFQIDYRHVRQDWSWIVDAISAALNAPGFELNGWVSWWYAELGWAQRWSGDEAGAQQTFEQGREKLNSLRARSGDNGYVAAGLAVIEAGLGNCDAALREAQAAVDAAGEDHYKQAGLVAVLASTQALCGRKEEALATLRQIAREPVSFIRLAHLRAAPEWNSLRDDPRFQKLVADAEAAMNAQPGK